MGVSYPSLDVERSKSFNVEMSTFNIWGFMDLNNYSNNLIVLICTGFTVVSQILVESVKWFYRNRFKVEVQLSQLSSLRLAEQTGTINFNVNLEVDNLSAKRVKIEKIGIVTTDKVTNNFPQLIDNISLPIYVESLRVVNLTLSARLGKAKSDLIKEVRVYGGYSRLVSESEVINLSIQDGVCPPLDSCVIVLKIKGKGDMKLKLRDTSI